MPTTFWFSFKLPNGITEYRKQTTDSAARYGNEVGAIVKKVPDDASKYLEGLFGEGLMIRVGTVDLFNGEKF